MYKLFLMLLTLVLFSCVFFNSRAQLNPTNADIHITSIDSSNNLETIINDMKLSHEGFPHGVPKSWDWAKKPRLNMGNSPKNFTALLAWGQLYTESNGNPALNARVQLKNLKTYILSKKTNTWKLVQDTPHLEGAAFYESFTNNDNKPAEIRDEEDGSISVTAGDGYNFHFWADERLDIDTADIGGIFTTAQARLIIDDMNKPDDRLIARFVLSIGADYYLDKTIVPDPPRTNKDAGIGRFKFVNIGWRSFNMTTVSEKELRDNPPPIK